MPHAGPEVNSDSVRLKGYPEDEVPADVARGGAACKALAPVLSDAGRQRKVEAALRYSQCIRDHGVERDPDPDHRTDPNRAGHPGGSRSVADGALRRSPGPLDPVHAHSR